jgi:hypothetical protein
VTFATIFVEVVANFLNMVYTGKVNAPRKYDLPKSFLDSKDVELYNPILFYMILGKFATRGIVVL